MSLAYFDRAADLIDGTAEEEDPATLARAQSVAEHDGPLDLACTLNHSTVRTPALELLSAELEHAIAVPGTRLIVSFSPQEGKARWPAPLCCGPSRRTQTAA